MVPCRTLLLLARSCQFGLRRVVRIRDAVTGIKFIAEKAEDVAVKRSRGLTKQLTMSGYQEIKRARWQLTVYRLPAPTIRERSTQQHDRLGSAVQRVARAAG